MVLVCAQTISPEFLIYRVALTIGGNTLAMQDVLSQIDAEIAKLQQARALLAGTPDVLANRKPGRGRPKGSKNTAATPVAPAAPAKKGKRQLSPEGRKAIAEAMKRRWAAKRTAK